MSKWDDSRWNPCNHNWYWMLVSWAEAKCLCCAITRAAVVFFLLGVLVAVEAMSGRWFWMIMTPVMAAAVAILFHVLLKKDRDEER